MDAFAQIAKEGIGGRTELLCVPPPPQPRRIQSRWNAARRLRQRRHRKCRRMLSCRMPCRRCGSGMRRFLRRSPRRWNPCAKRARCPISAGSGKRTQTGRKSLCRTTGAPLGNASTQYETEFTLREIPTDRRVFVVVNGADYKAHIFINNHLVGSHEGFFATFEFDITKWAHPGCNTLTIELEKRLCYAWQPDRAQRGCTMWR